MQKQAFLTPDTLIGDLVTVTYTLPTHLFLYLNGAMEPLQAAENWEQFGAVTPSAAAAFFNEVVLNKTGGDMPSYALCGLNTSNLHYDVKSYQQLSSIVSQSGEYAIDGGGLALPSAGVYLVNINYATVYTAALYLLGWYVEYTIPFVGTTQHHWRQKRVAESNEQQQAVESFTLVVNAPGAVLLEFPTQIFQASSGFTLAYATFTQNQVFVMKVS